VISRITSVTGPRQHVDRVPCPITGAGLIFH